MSKTAILYHNSLLSKIEDKIVKSTQGQPMASLGGAYANDWHSSRKPRGNVRMFPGGRSGLVGDIGTTGRSS